MTTPTEMFFAMINSLDRSNPRLLRMLSPKLKLKIARVVYKPLAGLRRGIVKTGGFTLRYPRQMDYCYALQEHEPEVQMLLRQKLKSGMNAIDVGANIGYHTVLMASLVGATGHIWAIEAGDSNVAWLRENLDRNQIKNATILPYAAGQRTGERTFYIHKDGGANSLHSADSNAHQTVVQEMQLDTIIDGPIDFVKMDIEGGELDALRGMQRILHDNSQIQIIVEWNPAALDKAGYSPETLPNFLVEAGFILSLIDDPNFTTVEQVLNAQHFQSTKNWHANLYARRQI